MNAVYFRDAREREYKRTSNRNSTFLALTPESFRPGGHSAITQQCSSLDDRGSRRFRLHHLLITNESTCVRFFLFFPFSCKFSEHPFISAVLRELGRTDIKERGVLLVCEKADSLSEDPLYIIDTGSPWGSPLAQHF